MRDFRRIWKIGIALFCGFSASGAETLRLENAHIAVEIDRASGGVRTIRDKDQALTYQVPGIGFAVTTDAKTLRSERRSRLKKVQARWS